MYVTQHFKSSNFLTIGPSNSPKLSHLCHSPRCSRRRLKRSWTILEEIPSTSIPLSQPWWSWPPLYPELSRSARDSQGHRRGRCGPWSRSSFSNFNLTDSRITVSAFSSSRDFSGIFGEFLFTSIQEVWRKALKLCVSMGGFFTNLFEKLGYIEKVAIFSIK